MRWCLVVLWLLSTANAPAVLGAGVDRTNQRAVPLQRLFGGGRSYAVVIGVSDYLGEDSGGFKPLSAARNDADRMARFLFEQARFDYVRVLTEDKATKASIERLMVDTIPRLLGPNDRFLFYWSGHGVSRTIEYPDGERILGYLPLTASQREEYSTMISMDDITRWDVPIRAKQTLFIIDACLSGLAGIQSKNDSRALTLEQLDRPSRQLFAAGSATDEAIAGDRWNGSLFTDAFIKGAAGAAAREENGVVSLAELLTYVRSTVAHEKSRARWGKAITPQVQTLQPSAGDFFFLKWPMPTNANADVNAGGGPSSKGAQEAPKEAVPRPDMVAIPVRESRPMSSAVPGPTPVRSLATEPSSGSAFRDALRGGSEGPAMVVISAGELLMGSPATEAGRGGDEGPQYRVTIPSFALGQAEVTFDDYDRFARATARTLPSDVGWGRGPRPVINVSWNDAVAYARWLSEQSGKDYRLPSEAEWEYAARAGTTTPFSTGTCISTRQANFDGNSTYGDCSTSGISLRKTQPVSSYPANPFGLHDMHGNVGEWTQDCWHQSYEAAPVDGSAWPEGANGECSRRVLRGGSWISSPLFLRSAYRDWDSDAEVFNFVGFRLARTL